MKKLIDYTLSGIYLLYFGLLLLIFHIAQIIAFHLIGPKAQKRVVDALNWCITYGWLLTGTRITYNELATLPEGRPIIFVANHQSMFDIPPIIWFLRRFEPIFVSKIELAKGIPSISYNLRKSGAALIDRQDSRQALTEIARLGTLIKTQQRAAVIFPEGTRSKTGKMKRFASGGVAILLKKAPTALIVPIAIEGTGQFNPTGIFPLTSFGHLRCTVLPGIEPADKTAEEIVNQAQTMIEEIISQ